MFSRTPGRSRSRRSSAQTQAAKTAEPPRYDTPLLELMGSLDRMEVVVTKAKKDYFEKSAAAPTKQEKRRSLFRSRSDGRRDSKDPHPPSKPSNAHYTPKRQAKFIPMDSGDEEEMIELLRRVAELVITGEKSAAAAQARNERRHRGLQEGSHEDRDEEVNNHNDTEAIDSHIALFEHFFERNALELIVNIVTGVAFSSPLQAKIENSSNSGLHDGTKGTENIDKTEANAGTTPMQESVDDNSTCMVERQPEIESLQKPECTMLPSLAIATQALQSVSILIQNVSRATSLYFLLSNNYINELTALPVELYSIAETIRLGETIIVPTPSRQFASAEVAEFATHFVTFLKSLAMRMNVETLQFFLSYPGERAGDESAAASSAHFSSDDKDSSFRAVGQQVDRTTEGVLNDNRPVVFDPVDVEFPLYARALEFCSAHQDPFVRVTAMNICLNTLRLATVSAEIDGIDQTPERAHGSSPDGVLHNARPLPLRERLAIAQHVCSPTRVGSLVSPIFTRLAQLWGVLEEQFREAEADTRKGYAVDLSSAANDITRKGRNSKLDRAKEEAKQTKLADSFRSSVADLHDELLLLEDVFKVGLSSLNEQIIEMMLATFVYPLLLQPLLQYTQRFLSARGGRPVRRLSNAFSGGIVPSHDPQSKIFGDSASANVSYESAPAKTAIFVLASVFHFVTNRPLRRLLFVALVHPLSPNASSGSILALPDVACDRRGQLSIRIDSEVSGPSQDETLTYSFGRDTGRKELTLIPIDSSGDNPTSFDTCVFVLSPALVEILEGDPADPSLIARTRSNPYRQALVRFLVEGQSMDELNKLTIMLFGSLVDGFNGKFLGDMLFGSGMRRFTEDVPVDEHTLDAMSAHESGDRGIGGGGYFDSWRSGASESRKVGTDYLAEIVTGLCLGVVHSSPCQNGLWNLHYDKIAAHSLLCAVSENTQALQSAAKLLDRRKRQTASFLAEMPSRIDFAVSSRGSRSVSLDEEEAGFGLLIDKIIHDSARPDRVSVVEELFLSRQGIGQHMDYLISVAHESSFGELTERACALVSARAGPSDECLNDDNAMELAAQAALGFFQLDALSSLVQELADQGGHLRRRRISGLSFLSDGTILEMSTNHERGVDRSVFAPLSKALLSSIQDQDNRSLCEKGPPISGSVVGLVGRTAFPCVCEVPLMNASLFANVAAGVTSDGVKWQSLYLVFLGRYLILAEPERGGSGGDGRVVTCCKLAQVQVEKDPNPPSGGGSSARRLIISHFGYETIPPRMFLFDEDPKETTVGPFIQLQKFCSSLDLWFEDENASDQAFNVLKGKISKARSKRGNRLRDRLSHEDRQRYAPR